METVVSSRCGWCVERVREDVPPDRWGHQGRDSVSAAGFNSSGVSAIANVKKWAATKTGIGKKIDSLKRIMYKLDKIDFFDILPRMWKTKNWEISYREGYLEANTSTFVFLDSLEKVIRNI